MNDAVQDIAAGSSLPHDLIKSSLEYLPQNQQLVAREVNQEWSRAVADVIECTFAEEGSSLMNGEWKPDSKLELRSVLCCISEMTETFKASIRKIRFPWWFTGDFGMEWIALETLPQLEGIDLTGSFVAKMTLSQALGSLRVLRLAACHQLNFNDGSVQGLELLPALEELNLSKLKSVKSVGHLSSFRSLKNLNLSECKGLTDEGILGLEVFALETDDPLDVILHEIIVDMLTFDPSQRLTATDLLTKLECVFGVPSDATGSQDTSRSRSGLDR